MHTQDGLDRPFFCKFETPGAGNVVRCVNTSPVEFPLAAAVVPYYLKGGREYTTTTRDSRQSRPRQAYEEPMARAPWGLVNTIDDLPSERAARGVPRRFGGWGPVRRS